MTPSAKDYEVLVKKWTETPDGKACIKETAKADTFNEQDCKKIAIQLRNEIIKAYLGEIRSSGKPKYYNMNTIDVKVLKPDKTGRPHLQIVFKGEGLWRYSFSAVGGDEENLYSDSSGYYTGAGVYDIIGLFTNGYYTDKHAYGTWIDPRTGREASWSDTYVMSTSYADDNPFVTHVIELFRRRYPFIEITYPELWGGTRKESGKWRRRPSKKS